MINIGLRYFKHVSIDYYYQRKRKTISGQTPNNAETRSPYGKQVLEYCMEKITSWSESCWIKRLEYDSAQEQ